MSPPVLHLTDINDFEAIKKLADALPEDERALFKANAGSDFNSEEFLIALAEVVGSAPYQHTIWDGETPIAACGFMPQRTGVYRTWAMVPDSSWCTHGPAVTEVFKSLISDMLEQKLAHRIETVTLERFEKVRAWFERIGLTYESTQRGYGAAGEDAVMYVALREVGTT